jgi:hypothetical protein
MADFYGPSGGTGGNPFEIKPPIDRNHTIDNTPYTMAGIILYVGSWIDSIQVIYRNIETEEVILIPTFKVGGGGGSEYPIDPGPGRYIIGISGKYGNFVDSIEAHFNDGNGYGIGGYGGVVSYKYMADPSQEVIGLWGNSGTYIDAIGVIVRPRL